MASSDRHCLGIFVLVSLGIFVVIIFIRIWFVNSPQDQIIILRGVFDEVDEILSELLGGEGVGVVVILPCGRLIDGHPSPITYFFSLKIVGVDGIYDTTITILEL